MLKNDATTSDQTELLLYHPQTASCMRLANRPSLCWSTYQCHQGPRGTLRNRTAWCKYDSAVSTGFLRTRTAILSSRIALPFSLMSSPRSFPGRLIILISEFLASGFRETVLYASGKPYGSRIYREPVLLLNRKLRKYGLY
jgi:hypothetical protein